MGRTEDLLDMVVLCTNADSAGARALGSELLDADGITLAEASRITAILALAEYLDANYSGAVVEAERGIELARASGDPDSVLLALAMRLLASAGTAWTAADPTDDYFAEVWRDRGRLSELDPEFRMIAGHVLVEATLSTGRMSEALEVLDDLAELQELRSPAAVARHAYPPFMKLQWARVAYFQGRLNDALPIVKAVADESRSNGNLLWESLAQGYLAVISAYRGDKATTRECVELMLAPFEKPVGYLGGAVYAIAGYALFAIGDTDRAAELGALGGGDEDLSNLQVGDRALTFELLVSAALARGDLAEAERWGSRSLALAAHPASAPIVEGIVAQIDLARGETAASAELAAVAAARARLTGRYLDAARADLLRARALAASGLRDSAVRELTEFAHGAQRDGIHVLFASANAELRRLGRRLPPAPGGGWASLSERERQIAVLAAEGFSNQVIGSTLFLSGRTVQSYMSRVLAALEIPSRTALPRHVADLRLGSPRDDLPALTPRQWQVAALVAEGLSNQHIASELNISVKTAEKHIGEILQRWRVTSRTSIAHLVIAETERSAG